MTSRTLGGLAAVVFFFGCFAGARASADNDACWQLLYRALERSAASPHSPYIRYSVGINITQDGQYYEQAHADIVYRDDGIAYVDDTRWVHPFVSAALEPGPPLLGPYGSERESWLSLMGLPAPGAPPVIADTHTVPTQRCEDRGTDTIDGVAYQHLVLPNSGRDAPGLKELWLNRSTAAIRRAVVSELLTFLVDYDGTKARKLVDYTIEVGHVHGYAVVTRVNWQYTYRTYTQWSTINAEYTFGNFGFETKPPLGSMFASVAPLQ
ncbi:MAG TPA: hypothetical protein VFN49_07500 [Candidatus Aquilonibacter sp.]|nr:hypothetical protein [Candidatus Aquilonibacter sp.]